MTKPVTSVAKNIFQLGELQIAEDRFSSAWGYVLDRESGLRDAVAQLLLRAHPERDATVVAVRDHP